MSGAGFGYQLSLLNPKYVEKSIEYTHCEIPAVGTVPVFRKAFGDLCRHRVYDVPLTQCKDSGTIWFDDNDMVGTWAEINRIADDAVLRNETREKAFEFYRYHQDCNHVFPDIMKMIEALA
jgi:hypothetical protein